jgi:hypothetical protein
MRNIAIKAVSWLYRSLTHERGVIIVDKFGRAWRA